MPATAPCMMEYELDLSIGMTASGLHAFCSSHCMPGAIVCPMVPVVICVQLVTSLQSSDPGIIASACLLQVYTHHCQSHLPPSAMRLRAAAMYIAENAEAIRWGLEICGFQSVHVDFRTRPFDFSSQSAAADDLKDLFSSPQPVLCHLHCSVRFSL